MLTNQRVAHVGARIAHTQIMASTQIRMTMRRRLEALARATGTRHKQAHLVPHFNHSRVFVAADKTVLAPELAPKVELPVGFRNQQCGLRLAFAPKLDPQQPADRAALALAEKRGEATAAARAKLRQLKAAPAYKRAESAHDEARKQLKEAHRDEAKLCRALSKAAEALDKARRREASAKAKAAEKRKQHRRRRGPTARAAVAKAVAAEAEATTAARSAETAVDAATTAVAEAQDGRTRCAAAAAECQRRYHAIRAGPIADAEAEVRRLLLGRQLWLASFRPSKLVRKEERRGWVLGASFSSDGVTVHLRFNRVLRNGKPDWPSGPVSDVELAQRMLQVEEVRAETSGQRIKPPQLADPMRPGTWATEGLETATCGVFAVSALREMMARGGAGDGELEAKGEEGPPQVPPLPAGQPIVAIDPGQHKPLNCVSVRLDDVVTRAADGTVQLRSGDDGDGTFQFFAISTGAYYGGWSCKKKKKKRRRRRRGAGRRSQRWYRRRINRLRRKRSRRMRRRRRDGFVPAPVRNALALRAAHTTKTTDPAALARARQVAAQTSAVLHKWWTSREASRLRFAKQQRKQRALAGIVHKVAPDPRTIVVIGDAFNGPDRVWKGAYDAPAVCAQCSCHMHRVGTLPPVQHLLLCRPRQAPAYATHAHTRIMLTLALPPTLPRL